ncbi:MAG: hypothetical protein KAH91_01065 [Thermoplasmatales archaeon]|nr:hypothetical protein [Thermoplasmatales archaeon]
MIPYKTVKRILKSNVNEEVTHQSVVCVKDFLDNVCKDIATASKREFDNYNELRELHKLPKSKRIPSFIFINFVTRLYNELTDVKDGNVGNASSNVTTTLSTDANEGWYYA